MRGPTRRPSTAPDGAGDDDRGAAGQDPQAGDEHAGAESVRGQVLDRWRQAARELEEARQQHPGRVEREAGQQCGQVGKQHRSSGEHAHVDHRLGNPGLGDDPGDQQDRRGGEQTEHERGGPTLGHALGEGDQQGNQPAREQHRAEDVGTGRQPDRRFGDEAPHQDEGHQPDHGRDDEQPAPVEVVDDEAGDDDAESAPDAERRGDGAHGDAPLLLGELIADDRVGERENGRPNALHAAEGDQ